MSSMNEALQWRYAVKAFDPKGVVPDQKVEQILEAARLAPSSFGLQPYHVTVITDQSLKGQLRPVSYNQSQISDCSHLLVFRVRKHLDEKLVDDYVQLIAETRGMTIDQLKGYRGVMVTRLGPSPEAPGIQEWAMRQAYIAMGFSLFAAAELKVDACPMEGISGPDYDRILGESDDLMSVAVVALGMRSETDQNAKLKKVRQPKDRFFTRR
jgi:nitroreductase